MRDSDDRDGVVDAPPASAPAGNASAQGGFDHLLLPEEEEFPRDRLAAEGDGDLFANAFTDEIQNVAASDWDVDADALWGGVEPDPYDAGTASGTALDFPV
ncbi:hypothetical protein [Microbacterium sp. CPCC 204701]|uniref:hypothetical protein n=1 Tax=Microbacterium sp. CPCC 204701 TaxID=2493084 RepID=UPI000FD7F534|nr:hypothetical protein [Microbacterium sp. CPCC 204701]